MRRPLTALPFVALAGTLTLLAACSSHRGDGGADLPPTSVVAPINRVYKFDPRGALPLEDRSELPVAPGAVTARWYAFRGWYVAVYDGLDLDASGPLCLRTSVLNSTTNQLEHVFISPTAEGACDSGGVGVVAPPAQGATGVRTCHGAVSYVTAIPAELDGALFATLTAFREDGSGVEIGGRVDSTIGVLGEIDESWLNCGPLPVARAIPSPTPEPTPAPTPAPPSSGDVAAADRASAPAPTEANPCAPAEPGTLQDITETDAAPYFVHHPLPDDPAAATVVFLGGGSGRRGSAERAWENFFASGEGAEAFRVVIPYSIDADFIDEASRTFEILNEVLWCYGGDPAKVHVAGTSNGGLAAFALMMKRPELFATLLGAPGAFPVQDPTTVDPAVWAEALAGRAVFNGVGANDDAWKPEVIGTHNALAAAGVESVFVEFAGQGHIVSEAFDESVFLDFWSKH